MMLHEREKAVLDTLAKVPRQQVVLVGGYAVNVYVPPRFSIDCDLVVLAGLSKLEAALAKEGYAKAEKGEIPYGSYVRYVNQAKGASFDLLVNAVLDRNTGISFERALFEKHSRKRTTLGRINPIRIELRVADPELLFGMKFVTGRRQDVRDLFMLAGTELDWDVVERIVRDKCQPELCAKRADEIRRSVSAKTYRPSLQGAFGKIPDERFEACKAGLLRFADRISKP